MAKINDAAVWVQNANGRKLQIGQEDVKDAVGNRGFKIIDPPIEKLPPVKEVTIDLETPKPIKPKRRPAKRKTTRKKR